MLLVQGRFEVKHRNKDSAIFWHLDNQYISTTYDKHTIECRPSAGMHHLKVVDQNGQSRTVSFKVK